MDDHLKQLLLLGREHYQKREYDKAEYLLRQVVAKTDRYADVYDMLGVIAHSRGDFVLAERYFEKAVGLNPNYTEAQLNLMVTYNDLGKYDAARQIYSLIRTAARAARPRQIPSPRARSPTCTRRPRRPIRTPAWPWRRSSSSKRPWPCARTSPI